MDIYTTEEQQIEAIKRWWKNNGLSILVGIGLAIGAVIAWQAWSQLSLSNKQAASVLYGQMLEASNQLEQARQQSAADQMEAQLTTMQHIGGQLKEEFEASEYAVFAALLLAKEAILSEQPKQAVEQLQWARQQQSAQAMKLIINLRLARALAADGQFDAALEQLESVEPGSQADAYEEVRGDIYLAMGDQDLAREAYRAAMELSALTGGQSRPVLKIKHDNLVVAGN